MLSGARPRSSRRRKAVDSDHALTSAALALLLILPAHADISGTVTITGKPNSKDDTFYAPVTGCGESGVRHTENWKIGPKGELGDVVVWIVDPKLKSEPTTVPPPLPPEIEIKQIGCRYVPHVIAVQAGQPFKVTNGDPTLHNVRANASTGPGQPPGPDLFNIGQPRQGQTDEETFSAPGIYTLQCNVHGWMQAWVMALPARSFGVTDTDGKFTIFQDSAAPIADGDYKIVLEKRGEGKAYNVFKEWAKRDSSILRPSSLKSS